MRLLILGATGRTGVFALKYALEQGYEVTIIVRDATAVDKHGSLTIVEGSLLSASDVDRAFAAASTPIDAVLSFLNPKRVTENPWSKFLGPPRLLADSTAIATKVLRRQKRQADKPKPRLVVLSALGTGESRKVTPLLLRLVQDYSNVYKTCIDHEAVNDEIEQNCGDEVEWTSTMAVLLTGAGIKDVKTFGSTQSGAGQYITRESCAKWMVDVAAGKFVDEFSNKRVIVSN